MVVLYWIAGILLFLGGLVLLIATKAGLIFMALGALLIFLAIRRKKQKKATVKITASTQKTPPTEQPEEKPKKSEGRYLNIKINGINYRPKNAASLCGDDGEYEGHGELVPDPDNEYDPNAIKICCEGVHLGFVPKDRIESVRRVLDKVKDVKISIEYVDNDDDSFYVGKALIYY